MRVELSRWWSNSQQECFRRFFRRSRRWYINITKPRLTLFPQHSRDAIQFVEKKEVRSPAGKLNNEPAKDAFVMESETYDAVEGIP